MNMQFQRSQNKNTRLSVQESQRSEPSTSFVGSLVRESSDPATILLFEVQLAQSGLLFELEKSGIMPHLNNPNPYDPVREQGQHNQWWEKNAQSHAEYLNQSAEREKTLQQLYLGMHLR